MRISPVNISYNIQNKEIATKQKSAINSTNNFYENKSLKYPAFAKSNINFNKRKEYYRFLSTEPEAIAQGTDGIIYKKGNEAIKVAKTQQTSFEQEAEILKKLPKSLKSAQHFIDRFSYEGKDVLVSSFVEGSHKQKLEPDDISKLYEVLLSHDEANIIHGDLNVGNIVFSDNGDISLIDYGAASIPTTTQVELYPEFVVNTNALKFENTGLNDSLKQIPEDEQLKYFKNYLSKKADFYAKHAELIRIQHPDMKEAIEYEENLAKVLANPSDDVIETELRRITTLDFLETADTATNYEHNPHKAINLWNSTVESAKETIKHTQHQLQAKILSSEERKYFENQKKIAQSFYYTLSQWRAGTFDWLHQIKQPYYQPQSEAEQAIKRNWECL